MHRRPRLIDRRICKRPCCPGTGEEDKARLRGDDRSRIARETGKSTTAFSALRAWVCYKRSRERAALMRPIG